MKIKTDMLEPKKDKLPAKKYLRVHDEQFKEWITEVMQQSHMRFARLTDVAEEIERIFGGLASSWVFKLRDLRINVEDYKPEKK